MPTPLCETVTGRTMAELVAARENASSRADMVELRLDGIADVDVPAAIHGRKVPVVVTCRPQWEGGAFDGSEQERQRILTQALDLGAEFVDVEWRTFENSSILPELLDRVGRNPSRVVVSSHDFTGIPPDLESRARAMRATGVGTIKLAVSVGRLRDTLCLAAIPKSGPAVVIGLGEVGVPSRVLAARFGSRWTYAGNGVAPGQLPTRALVDDYGYRRVTATASIFGVVSTNALHSLSPVMHNAAFQAANIDSVYVPFTVTEFADFLAFAEGLGVAGASVTIPFKLDALRAARSSDALTQQVGAANTLRRRDQGWHATNTDVEGFLQPLEAAFPGSLAAARVSVLGAGGSARAVIVALDSRGARVAVHARRVSQAQELAGRFGVAIGPYPPPPGSWDLLVNCTPLGGAGLRSASPMNGVPLSGRVVYDLTYGPGESPLVRDARAAGLVALDGLAMLVAQAERQFEWWTGQKPKQGVMEAAARRRLSEPLGLNSRIACT